MTPSLPSQLARHWRMLRYVLNVCRFSLIVLLAGVVLLSVDQGQDLLRSTAEDGRTVLLLGSCLLWAFSIWLWTRTLLEIRFPGTPTGDWRLLAAYRLWMPRILGLAPFVVVALNALTAGTPADGFVLPTVLLGIAFGLLVVYRRPLGRLGAQMLKRRQAKASRLWVENMKPRAPELPGLWSAASSVLGKAAFALLGLGALLLVWGLADPLGMGEHFNALALLMVWGATFLPIGSLITYYANRTGLPFVTVLLVLAVVFSLWNDNHAIRPLPPGVTRVSVEAALDAWAQAHCRGRECGPLVVVATAGGGIRAAYWTGTVLGHLDDRIVRTSHAGLRQTVFRDRLFAVSGVSGGSVGAAVYRGIITQPDNRCGTSVLECSARVLSKDFLSPLSVSLLYPDLLQRFLPVALLSDRGRTLETAFEQSFRNITGGETLSRSFSALGSEARHAWPALFLNATWSNNGRRLVAASVDIGDSVPGHEHFRLANDQLGVIGYDVRLSTAAHNSARFPYVSPPGSWHAATAGNPLAGDILGRLQDGGLFENYGAETALEILALADQHLRGRHYTPVVVLISSDPALPADFAVSLPGRVDNFGYEVLTTARTLAHSREGHGAEAAARLRNWASRRGREFVYFRMCDPRPDEAGPPLGWALSKEARLTIEGYLLERSVLGDEPLAGASCRHANRASARALCTQLLGSGSTVPDVCRE